MPRTPTPAGWAANLERFQPNPRVAGTWNPSEPAPIGARMNLTLTSRAPSGSRECALGRVLLEPTWEQASNPRIRDWHSSISQQSVQELDRALAMLAR